MAKLILNQVGKEDEEFLLDKDQMTVGRNPDNDIVLVDGTVSGNHALLIRRQDISAPGGEVFSLEDKNSTNGTFVNGERITSQKMSSGDIVQFGKLRLMFSQTAITANDSTMIMTQGMITDGRMIAVKFLTGVNMGQIKVVDKEGIRIGTKGTGIAEIARRGDDCYITYVGGAFLPKVNERKIGIEKHLLSSKDVVEVGPDKLEILVQ
ncbi:MAG: FHA domain-containing protein [Gammaproteobacteria bacterium]|nr:FHA domain-containing protein [Gammaproteobacteria bacterium]